MTAERTSTWQLIETAVRRLTATDLGLPWSADSHPLAAIEPYSLKRVYALHREFPEKRGRLCDAFLRISGGKRPLWTNFTTLEAHVDMSSTTPGLDARLIAIGFEPDHFFRLHPECYKRHYTLQFICDAEDARRRRFLRRELGVRSNRALKLLVDTTDVFGYLEQEVYGSSAQYRPDGASLSEESLNALIEFLDGLTFQRWEISNRAASGLADVELPHTTVKKADVHVKFRSPELAPVPEMAPRLYRLAAALEKAGFYEIVSEAGNVIYTAQFLDAALAKRVFARLREVVRRTFAPLTLCVEPCVGFERFGAQRIGGECEYAPVPPVLTAR